MRVSSWILVVALMAGAVCDAGAPDTARPKGALPANTQGSAQASRLARSLGFVRIPVVIGYTHLPGIGSDKNKAKARAIKSLDEPIESGAGSGVLAAAAAVKRAGWSAGFEFGPFRVLKKGEKPGEVIRALKERSRWVLLVRASSRTVRLNKVLLTLLADAGLFDRKSLRPVLARGLLAVSVLAEDQIENGKITETYWMKVAVRTFASKFDKDFLGDLKRLLKGDEIAAAVARLKAAPSAGVLKPRTVALGGGKKREPELTLTAAAPKSPVVVYWGTGNAGEWRRWYLTTVAPKVDSGASPGRRLLFAAPALPRTGKRDRVFKASLDVRYKTKYVYTIPAWGP